MNISCENSSKTAIMDEQVLNKTHNRTMSDAKPGIRRWQPMANSGQCESFCTLEFQNYFTLDGTFANAMRYTLIYN